MSGLLNEQESMNAVTRLIALGRKNPFPFKLCRDYDLDGPEGNAMAIVGSVKQVIREVMKAHEFSKEEIKEVTKQFVADCLEREYDDLLVHADSFVSFNWIKDGERLTIVRCPDQPEMVDHHLTALLQNAKESAIQNCKR